MNQLPVFRSFVGLGFECTYSLTGPLTRLDMLSATQHDRYVNQDYRRARNLGIRTVREGLSWHGIDRGKVYDFSRFERIMEAGQRHGIQQIWDLNHFDYPQDLDAFSPDFPIRFAAYANQAIRVLRRTIPDTIYIVPVNEISFFSWIAADRGAWAPFRKGRSNGFRFKSQLVRAAIAAMDAIWEEDSNVRFIQVDPFMRRLARPPANTRAIAHAREFNNIVRFEAWDMLAGMAHPELGGHPKYLDIIGMNYYTHNQEWVLSPTNRTIAHRMMDWHSPDRVPFQEMIAEVVDRYHRPVYVSETGSYGRKRTAWWQRLLAEIDEGLRLGLPIVGICAYPALDRPDDVGYLLPKSGIWDFRPGDRNCHRTLHRRSGKLIRDYSDAKNAP